MEEEQAKKIIENAGYPIEKIKFIPEGTSHYIFDIITKDKIPLIARFMRHGKDNKTTRIDGIFGGELSLEREATLCDIVRNEANLPAPRNIHFHKDDDIKSSFLLVEKLPGKDWNDYLLEQDFSFFAYTRSIASLGSAVAKAEQVTFPTFGNIMPNREIFPAEITNFADRLRGLFKVKYNLEERTQSLTQKQLSEVKDHVKRKLGTLSNYLGIIAPTLVIGDLHPYNHLVDENGLVSGFPDLERSQAGIPSQELFQIRMTMFAYFNQKCFDIAEEIFFQAYHSEGGKYNPNDERVKELDHLMIIGQMLTCVTAYHGAKDGIRDFWSKQFKEHLFNLVQGKEIDYIGIGNVFRTKTRQPTEPNYL
jgi:hypothetical protein